MLWNIWRKKIYAMGICKSYFFNENNVLEEMYITRNVCQDYMRTIILCS